MHKASSVISIFVILVGLYKAVDTQGVEKYKQWLYSFSLNHCCNVVYPDIVASCDHVFKFILTARSGAQVVADWLVSLPPGPPGTVQYNVLIWG